MDLRETLTRLCSAGGPSGYERPVCLIAAELLKPLTDEVYIDRLNNVIAVRRSGKPNTPRLVLDAHLDEVGLAVTGIEDGFLHFCAIGGVDPRILPGLEVTVLGDKPMPGVVICTPPHILKKEDSDKSIPIKDLVIDIGLSQQQAQAAVPLGTPIVFRSGCFALADGRMCGKSMDDRACFVSLLRTLQLLQGKDLDVDLYVMGSTFEEVTSSGAKAGVYAIQPDWCIAVDVTHGETPDASKEKTFKLGGGPVIGIGPNMMRWMSGRLKQKAAENKLDVQLEVMGGHSGTNAWPIQISREGIPTAVVSLPLKYMHTPVETLDLSDVEAVAQLLAAFAVNLGKEAGTC